MSSFSRRSFMNVLFGSALGWGLGPSLWAEDSALDRGFVVAVKPYTTGVEIARQLAVWEMEVQMKLMRMITVAVPGAEEPQQVWYLAYRAIPRPLIKSSVGVDVDPVNTLDPPPGPPMFIPQMTLVTYDDASAWAETIREVVDDGRMPPWYADPRHGKWSNERVLSKSDKATIRAWVEDVDHARDEALVP